MTRVCVWVGKGRFEPRMLISMDAISECHLVAATGRAVGSLR